MLLNSTSIPNSLLEALFFTKEFSPVESKLLLFICRKTIGWNKETQWLTQEYIAHSLGWKEADHIYQYIQNLRKKKAIIIEDKIEDGKKKRYYSLDSDRWGIPGSLPGQQVVSLPGTIKDTNKKDTKREEDKLETNLSVSPSETSGAGMNQLIDLFKHINPLYKSFFAIPPERNALKRLTEQIGFEKLRSLLEVLPEIVKRPFSPRISTPRELESKFGQLTVFMRQEQPKQKSSWIII